MVLACGAIRISSVRRRRQSTARAVGESQHDRSRAESEHHHDHRGVAKVLALRRKSDCRAKRRADAGRPRKAEQRTSRSFASQSPALDLPHHSRPAACYRPGKAREAKLCLRYEQNQTEGDHQPARGDRNRIHRQAQRARECEDTKSREGETHGHSTRHRQRRSGMARDRAGRNQGNEGEHARIDQGQKPSRIGK